MKSNYIFIALVSNFLLLNNMSHAQSSIDAGYAILDEVQLIIDDQYLIDFEQSYIPDYGFTEFAEPPPPTLTDLERGLMPGYGFTEFADPELPNHERAIGAAIQAADQVSSDGYVSPLERVGIINEIYFSNLENLGSSLPLGPLESMDYFFANSMNDDMDIMNDMLAYDEQVRSGEITAIMPAQFPLAFPQEFSGFNAVQQLGVSNAVTLIIPDSGLAIAYHFGGYGGTIALGERALSFPLGDVLPHEANHSGEIAILNIIEDDTVDGPNQSSFDALTIDDYQEVTDAYSIIRSDLEGQTVGSVGCSICDQLSPERREYILNPIEQRAFAVEGRDGVRGYSMFLTEIDGVSGIEGLRIAERILSSPALQEQAEIINSAAQTLIDRGF